MRLLGLLFFLLVFLLSVDEGMCEDRQKKTKTKKVMRRPMEKVKKTMVKRRGMMKSVGGMNTDDDDDEGVDGNGDDSPTLSPVSATTTPGSTAIPTPFSSVNSTGTTPGPTLTSRPTPLASVAPPPSPLTTAPTTMAPANATFVSLAPTVSISPTVSRTPTIAPAVTPQPSPAPSSAGVNVPLPLISFDATASDSTTDEAVAGAVDLFLQDFLQRKYPDDYKGTDVETAVTATGDGGISVETTGDAVFKGSPTTEEMTQDLAEYLANGGDAVLADYLANAGVTDVSNISLDGEVVGKDTEEDSSTVGVNQGAIAGGVVGGVAACSILVCCFVWFRRGSDVDDDEGEDEPEKEETKEDDVAVEGEGGGNT